MCDIISVKISSGEKERSTVASIISFSVQAQISRPACEARKQSTTHTTVRNTLNVIVAKNAFLSLSAFAARMLSSVFFENVYNIHNWPKWK